MRVYGRMLVNALCIGLAGTIVLGSIGCRGPQGPTWKEQVTKALEHYYKGEDEHRKGNLDAAEREYLTSLELSARPITYVRLSQVQQQKGNTDEALINIDQALRLSPNNQRAIVFKEQLMLRKGNGANEASPRTSNGAVDGDSFELKIPTVDELVNPAGAQKTESAPIEKDIESQTIETPAPEISVTEAIAPTKIEEIHAESSSTLSLPQQAKAAAQKGEWEQARSLYEKALQDDSQNAQMYYNYGYTCFHLNRLEEAVTSFRRAVEINPTFADAYNDLGVTLERLRQSGEAVKAYQQAVEIGSNKDAFFNLALLSEKKGQYKESVELYERYLELDGSGSFAEHARERIEKLRRLAY